MPFINNQGQKISFYCEELIEELKQDIAEFGGHEIVYVWCKDTNGVTIYTNYDFILSDEPIDNSEIEPDEYIKTMSMTTVLMLLEEQNEVL